MQGRWLLQCIQRICYLHSVVLGLMPATLNWRKIKFVRNRWYLLYSCLVHSLHIINLPLLYTQIESNNWHVQRTKIILIYCEYLNVITKLLAIFAVSATIWLRRQTIMRTFARFRRLQQRYTQFIATEQCRVYERRMQTFLITKFITANVNFVLIIILSFDLHEGPTDVFYWLLRCIGYIQTHIILETMFQFFSIFANLYRHFACINLNLREILKQLNADRYMHEADFLQLQRRLYSLLRMHYDCYRLAVCVFSICELPAAAVILKLFTVNVNMLYHAVLAANELFGSDDILIIVSCCLAMFFHYFDCSYLMFMIENVVNTCNETAQLVRELNCHTFSNKKCNRLVDTICRPKLRFLILGLFEFDKPSSLRFVLTVILQVYALLQLDLTLTN